MLNGMHDGAAKAYCDSKFGRQALELCGGSVSMNKN